MRTLITAVFVVGVALPSVPVAADDGEPSQLVLPTLKVEGGTDDKAKLKIGADVTFPAFTNRDLTIAPSFATTTDKGVASLFSLGSSGITARDLLFSLQFALTELAPRRVATDAEAADRMWVEFDKCVKECTLHSPDKFCKRVRAGERAADIKAVTAARGDADAVVKTAESVVARWNDERERARQRSGDSQQGTAQAKAALDLARQRAETLRQQIATTAEPLTRAARQRELAGLDDTIARLVEQAAATTREQLAAETALAQIGDAIGLARAAAETAHARLAEHDQRLKTLQAALAALENEVGKQWKFDYWMTTSNDLCASGQKVMNAASTAAHDKRLEYPRRIYAIGFSAGVTQHKFLRPEANSMTGNSKPDSESTGAAAVAGSFTMLSKDSSLSLEVPVRLTLKSEVGTDQIHWCKPSGTVEGAPGEICEDRPLGPPVAKTTAEAAVLLGIINPQSTSYRVAFGPTFKSTDGDQSRAKIEAGLKLPIYLNTNLLPDGKGIFKGIVRVTPSVIRKWDREAKTQETTFTIDLELLTGRSLFTSALDLL